MNRPFAKLMLLSIGVVGLATSGCVVVPPHRVYVGGVVRVGPPPVRREVIGVAPAPGYVWINGYWSWRGDRYVWLSGHWVAPRPGYRWVTHRWVHERDGWHLTEGHWDRR